MRRHELLPSPKLGKVQRTPETIKTGRMTLEIPEITSFDKMYIGPPKKSRLMEKP